MRVCVTLADQSFAKTKSLGIFNVSRGLVRGLAACPEVEEVVVLVSGAFDDGEFAGCGEGRVRVEKVCVEPPSGVGRVLWDQWRVVAAVDAVGADWVLFPKGFPPLWRWPKAKVCCYVHDNIFSYYRRRGWRAFPAFERWYFPASLRRAAVRSDVVVTNSEFTAEEVRALGGGGRVARVGIGFDDPPAMAGVEKGERGGVLLLVSGQPHKLTAQAVEWLKRWKEERGSGLTVYGVGTLPEDVDWPAGSDWELCGRVGDDEYEVLWGSVDVMLYFSTYEGYGMPPVEAAMRGVKALASDLPAHRENVPVEWLFDNGSWDDFAAKLDGVLAEEAGKRAPLEPEPWRVVAGRVVEAMGVR